MHFFESTKMDMSSLTFSITLRKLEKKNQNIFFKKNPRAEDFFPREYLIFFKMCKFCFLKGYGEYHQKTYSYIDFDYIELSTMPCAKRKNGSANAGQTLILRPKY